MPKDRPIEANPRLLVERIDELEQEVEDAFREMRDAYKRAQDDPREIEGRIWANSRISSFERVVGNVINTLGTSDTVTRQEDAAASHLASRIEAFSKMLENEFPFLREAGDESPREAVYESPIHSGRRGGARSESDATGPHVNASARDAGGITEQKHARKCRRRKHVVDTCSADSVRGREG